MDILQLIKKRTAIRKYKNISLPEEVINKIIDAGIWGPSLVNIQPWRFIVITNKKVMKEISNILYKKSKKLYAGFNISVRQTSEVISQAPAIIAIFSTGRIVKMMSKFGKLYDKCGRISEIEAISAAVQNMVLTAEELKIGTNWFAFPIFCSKEISKLLNVNDELLAVLTLGYPAEEGKRASRKPFSESVRYIR